MVKIDRKSSKIFLAGLWLAFTLSLAVWWTIYGLRQIEVLKSVQQNVGVEIAKQHKMIMWEGSILILLLLAGGFSLLYYIYLSTQRHQQVREFFASFTHDLKTSLASLKLQAESLQEDFTTDKEITSSSKQLLARLLKDSVRLELQLENSLFLSNVESNQLFLEKLSLGQVAGAFSHQWPEIKFQIDRDVEILADERATESILKNIVQNSIVHGGATSINIKVQDSSQKSTVSLVVEDNGRGFSGDMKKLGTLFVRHNTRSGTGVGLYLAKELMSKMGGEITFTTSEGKGFGARLTFKGIQP